MSLGTREDAWSLIPNQPSQAHLCHQYPHGGWDPWQIRSGGMERERATACSQPHPLHGASSLGHGPDLGKCESTCEGQLQPLSLGKTLQAGASSPEIEAQVSHRKRRKEEKTSCEPLSCTCHSGTLTSRTGAGEEFPAPWQPALPRSRPRFSLSASSTNTRLPLPSSTHTHTHTHTQARGSPTGHLGPGNALSKPGSPDHIVNREGQARRLRAPYSHLPNSPKLSFPQPAPAPPELVETWQGRGLPLSRPRVGPQGKREAGQREGGLLLR
jgi:hypothetical protein